MRHPKRTEEEKAEALRLLAAHGTAEASRRTGIPAGTIASWGSRNGVHAPPLEQCAAMVERAELTWAQRRVSFGERLSGLAEKAATNLEERLDSKTTAGIRDHAAVIAVLTDKAQLLTGGATSRTEVVERSPEAEGELAQVLELVRSA